MNHPMWKYFHHGNPVSDLSQGQNGKTRDVIADMAGVSAGNVSKVEYIKEHAPEAAKEQLRSDLNISSNLTESIDTRKEVSFCFRQF